jgi:hypothetical protein
VLPRRIAIHAPIFPEIGYDIGTLRQNDDRRHHADREILRVIVTSVPNFSLWIGVLPVVTGRSLKKRTRGPNRSMIAWRACA